MPVTTSGQAYASGAVATGVQKWHQAGGGTASRLAVEKWIGRAFPDMGSSARTALYNTIRDAHEIGSRYNAGGSNLLPNAIDYTPKVSSLPDIRRAMGKSTAKANASYQYSVRYQYSILHADGERTTSWFSTVLRASEPLSRIDLQNKLINRSKQASELFGRSRTPDVGDKDRVSITRVDVVGVWISP